MFLFLMLIGKCHPVFLLADFHYGLPPAIPLLRPYYGLSPQRAKGFLPEPDGNSSLR
jgi:hypothetical protein